LCLTSAFIRSSNARLCRKTESQRLSPLTYWPQIQYWLSTDRSQPINQLQCLMLNSYQIIEQTWFLHKMLFLQWLSLIHFSRYWTDNVFALNGTVTLTFDPVTSKCKGVIYWPWLIFLQSTMTVTKTVFKILNGHGFCIKRYCDLYRVNSKCKRGHLLTITNLPTKHHDCHSKLFNILNGQCFCIKWYCDLDLWSSDLEM